MSSLRRVRFGGPDVPGPRAATKGAAGCHSLVLRTTPPRQTGLPATTARSTLPFTVRRSVQALCGAVRDGRGHGARTDASRGAAGAVTVPRFTTGHVDDLPGTHPEIDWTQLRAVEKGRRSPLAALAKAGQEEEEATAA